jgi:hypothetical protein
VAAGEVLVGVRADDAESPPVVAAFAERLPVRIVEARGVGRASREICIMPGTLHARMRRKRKYSWEASGLEAN